MPKMAPHIKAAGNQSHRASHLRTPTWDSTRASGPSVVPPLPLLWHVCPFSSQSCVLPGVPDAWPAGWYAFFPLQRLTVDFLKASPREWSLFDIAWGPPGCSNTMVGRNRVLGLAPPPHSFLLLLLKLRLPHLLGHHVSDPALHKHSFTEHMPFGVTNTEQCWSSGCLEQMRHTLCQSLLPVGGLAGCRHRQL